VKTLFVAAGGGGDAVAAVLVRRMLAPHEDGPALVSSCAWERLRIDPVPGPRPRSAFRDLEPIGGVPLEITPKSQTIPPGRSLLPRVAADGSMRVFLHDFEGGAVGLADQLTHLVVPLEVDKLVVIDVGGDIVARGDEPALMSPLADSLTLAACLRLAMPVTVVVLGPGVDGELPAPSVRELLRAVGATRAGRVRADDVDNVSSLLAWHPTEATTITAAAALGAQGAVDMRRGGPPVPMDAASAEVWIIEHPAPHAFPIARALMSTASLSHAEEVVRRVAISELDYERERANQRYPAEPITLAAFAEASRALGATHATTRRILEATHADPSDWPNARVNGLGLWALDGLTAQMPTNLPAPPAGESS